MLYFYFSFLLIGIGCIAALFINEQRKNSAQNNNFIRDQLLEFLKIKPLEHKIEHLEKELRQAEIPSDEELIKNIWKVKCRKLDALFQEKSMLLAKAEEALNNEIKNRSEFQNLKYLLEEEIEKGKEKRRRLQAELNSFKTENENLRSKLTELENQAASPVVAVPHAESTS